MNSFAGIFQWFYLDFKNTVLSPHALSMYCLKPPVKFWRAAPMFSTSAGNPAEHGFDFTFGKITDSEILKIWIIQCTGIPQIGGFPVQNPLVAQLGLETQLLYETPGNI